MSTHCSTIAIMIQTKNGTGVALALGELGKLGELAGHRIWLTSNVFRLTLSGANTYAGLI